MIRSRELLADIQRLEAEHLSFCCERTIGDPTTTPGITRTFGDAIAVADPERPSRQDLNRLYGLTAASLPDLDQMLAFFGSRGARPCVDLLDEALTPSVAEALRDRGFAPSESVMFLTHDLAHIEAPTEGVAVRRLGPEDRDLLFDLMETGGESVPPEIRAAKAPHHCTERHRCWMASIGAEPTAWAALYVSGARGLLTSAWTRPDGRRRGCQSALYRARLADAKGLGLDYVVTDTAPGSSSHRNAMRAGFRGQAVVTTWLPPSRG